MTAVRLASPRRPFLLSLLQLSMAALPLTAALAPVASASAQEASQPAAAKQAPAHKPKAKPAAKNLRARPRHCPPTASAPT